MKRLFECELTVRYLAIASDALEAADFVDRAVQDVGLLYDQVAVQPLRISEGFVDLPAAVRVGDLIYHSGREEITVGEAIAHELKIRAMQDQQPDLPGFEQERVRAS